MAGKRPAQSNCEVAPIERISHGKDQVNSSDGGGLLSPAMALGTDRDSIHVLAHWLEQLILIRGAFIPDWTHRVGFTGDRQSLERPDGRHR